eukprot:330937-Chlamydomonas_euryale.AAC.3
MLQSVIVGRGRGSRTAGWGREGQKEGWYRQSAGQGSTRQRWQSAEKALNRDACQQRRKRCRAAGSTEAARALRRRGH